MRLIVDEKEFNLVFSYRVISAILQKLNIHSLTDMGEIADKFRMTNVHQYIHLALTVSTTGRDGKKPGNLPSAADIEWHMEENPKVLGEFLNGFMEGVASLTGGDKNELDAQLTSGN